MPRIRETLLLAWLFWVFFTRRILSVGILRRQVARWSILLAGIVLVGGLTAVAFLFLKDVFTTPQTLRLLLESSAMSAGFITLVAFVFVKILFLKSSSLLEFTRLLPATNRERFAALSLFESIMVFAAAVMTLAPLAIATVFLTGGEGSQLLLVSLLYPMFVGYLLLAVLYNFLTQVLLATGLTRGAQLIVNIFFAALIFVYNAQVKTSVCSLTAAYLDGGSIFTGMNAFLMLEDRYGAGVSAIIFIVVSIVGVVLVVVTAPSVALGGRRFLNVPVPGIGRSPMSVYVAAILRRWEIWFTAMLAGGAMAYLVWSESSTVAYASGFVLFEGIFVYVATKKISEIGPTRPSAELRFSLMIGAQGLVTLAFSLPISFVAVAAGNSWQSIALFYGVAVSANIVLALVGVVFPPEKDNPFSVFVGLAVTVIVVGIVMLVTGLLSLPLPTLVFILVPAHLLLVYYGVVGIRSLEKETRHEIFSAGS